VESNKLKGYHGIILYKNEKPGEHGSGISKHRNRRRSRGRLPAGPGYARACSRRWSAKSPSPSSRPQGRRALDADEELGFCAAHRLPLPNRRPTPPPPGEITGIDVRRRREGHLYSRLFTRPSSKQARLRPSPVRSKAHSTRPHIDRSTTPTQDQAHERRRRRSACPRHL
jgi:hypothetical protein